MHAWPPSWTPSLTSTEPPMPKHHFSLYTTYSSCIPFSYQPTLPNITNPMHIFTPNHPSYPFLSLNSHPCKLIHVHASPFSFPCKPILIPPNHPSYPFLSLNSHPCKPIFIPMQTHSHSHAHIHTQPSLLPVSLSKLSSMQTHSRSCKPILIPMQPHSHSHAHINTQPSLISISFSKLSPMHGHPPWPIFKAHKL